MALTNLTGSNAAAFNIKITSDNYNQPSETINQPVNQAYSFGTGINQADLLYSAELTIAPSATTVLDLDQGNLTDVFGNGLTFVDIKSIRLHHAADSAASQISLSGSFMTTNFGAGFSILYVPGGFFNISESNAGFPITAGTGDTISIANGDGSNSAIVSIEIMGTSA